MGHEIPGYMSNMVFQSILIVHTMYSEARLSHDCRGPNCWGPLGIQGYDYRAFPHENLKT